ncbi:hypothetical protein EST38_g9327 [Candolleomyces aberdarensis]|uniref:Major facilitator superfamily (MFS) profile domain-containing protein n=1 Tax=Candolleomyces aberdarensis TaxID=2316362 RepID=A0A4Q2DA75_9AGAR|nr:hypothetical protein EST38_g9327 [Candolleomyces aberdarensis]
MASLTPRVSGFWADQDLDDEELQDDRPMGSLSKYRRPEEDDEGYFARVDEDLEQQEGLLDEESAYDRRTPLDRTIDRIGMGSYQWTLLSLCGLGWMADNMWIQAIAIILPRVQQHYSVPDSYIGLVSSSMFGGMMIGAIGWGTCSDLMGRITAFNATLCLTAVFGILASFANSFPSLCVILFLLGSSVGGSMPTDGTLLLEHMPKKKQYLVTALSVFFSFGAVLSAVVALLVVPQHSCPPRGSDTVECDPDTQNIGWKYLLTALGLITLSMFIARIVFFRLHESPRYLVHAGRPHDAIKSLQLISRFNGSDLEVELEDVRDYYLPHEAALPPPSSNAPNSMPRSGSPTALDGTATTTTGELGVGVVEGRPRATSRTVLFDANGSPPGNDLGGAGGGVVSTGSSDSGRGYAATGETPALVDPQASGAGEEKDRRDGEDAVHARIGTSNPSIALTLYLSTSIPKSKSPPEETILNACLATSALGIRIREKTLLEFTNVAEKATMGVVG